MRGLAARMKQASETVVQNGAQEKEAGPKAQPTGIEPDSRNEAEGVEQNEAVALGLTAEGDSTNQTIEPEPAFQYEAEDIEHNEAGGERVKAEGGEGRRAIEEGAEETYIQADGGVRDPRRTGSEADLAK